MDITLGTDMKIILEGPDGGGKTTLADALCKKTGFPVVHLTYIKDANLMENQFYTAMRMNNVIIDRYVVSNMAYSHVFGNTPVKLLDSYWSDARSSTNHTIICLPCVKGSGVDGYEKMYRQLIQIRNEMYPNVPAMCEVYKYYQHAYEFMKLSKFKVDLYDYTKDDIDSFISNLNFNIN